MIGTEKQLKWATEILTAWEPLASNETAKRGLEILLASGKAGDVINARDLADSSITEALMVAARIADKFGADHASHGALNRDSQLRYQDGVLDLVESELKEIRRAARAARKS